MQDTIVTSTDTIIGTQREATQRQANYDVSRVCPDLQSQLDSQLIRVTENHADQQEGSLTYSRHYFTLRLPRPESTTEGGLAGCSSTELVAWLREEQQAHETENTLADELLTLITTAMSEPIAAMSLSPGKDMHLIVTGAMNPPTPMHVIQLLVALAKLPAAKRDSAALEIAPDGDLYLEYKQLSEDHYNRGKLSFIERVTLLRRLLRDMVGIVEESALFQEEGLQWVLPALKRMQITDRIPSLYTRTGVGHITRDQERYEPLNYHGENIRTDEDVAIVEYIRKLQLRRTEFAGFAGFLFRLFPGTPLARNLLLAYGKAAKLEAARGFLDPSNEVRPPSLFNGRLRALCEAREPAHPAS